MPVDVGGLSRPVTRPAPRLVYQMREMWKAGAANPSCP
jgi:hypothetical protein